MTRSAALSAYRTALRATRVAFKNDAEVLLASRAKIKQGFFEDLEQGSQTVQEKIDNLNSVSKFLVQNIVQGEKKEDGQYFLNIHDKTELGDNETIKQKKADMGSLAGAKATKRCSDK
ncbi:mitochondrial zinc maintenance protein 1, mitochondrial [[Candida] anglica]|uniref:Mitochondrial zinc maintenance protein 1, mitochondrial n=1 Tax=[Candida] anglica TaxID=148631 RepID=A0ABP0EK07_9ASCO